MGKGDLALLLREHVVSLQDEGYMRSNIEVIERYESLLVAFAGKTSRLRVGDVEAARQLYPEAGSCCQKTFAQRLAAAMSTAVTKARHCSTGAALHPPALQRLVRALKGDPTSSCSGTSEARGSTLDTPQDIAALWGVKPPARSKRMPAGCIDIYSSQEIEEAESAGGEQEVEEAESAGGKDSWVPEPEKVETGGATGSSQVPGGVGEPGPGQGVKEVDYPDLQRGVMVVMLASRAKQECKLRKGPQGTAVYDKAGSVFETEIPNLMLDPPVLKRPAAAPKPAAGRKKAKKEQELAEEQGGGAQAPPGPHGEAEEDEGEGEV